MLPPGVRAINPRYQGGGSGTLPILWSRMSRAPSVSTWVRRARWTTGSPPGRDPALPQVRRAGEDG